MVITFLIGNGFDLNVGLNTRYVDFYNYYCNLKSAQNDMIVKKIKGDYENWSDLEMGLARMASNLDDEQIEEFLRSKEKMEDALITYLRAQEERVSFSEGVAAEHFRAQILSFYKKLNMEWSEEYQALMRNSKEGVTYQFVNFNYTNILDSLISLCQNRYNPFSNHTIGLTTYSDVIRAPLHIHGTLRGDLILGIDSMKQIDNLDHRRNPELAAYLVKSDINKALGEKRMERLYNMIDKSRYLVLYGLSWGSSDQTWWKYIMKWLLKDAHNRLILCTHVKGAAPVSGARKVRLANQSRLFFSQQGLCDKDSVQQAKDRIHVLINSDIFSTNGISVRAEIKQIGCNLEVLEEENLVGVI